MPTYSGYCHQQCKSLVSLADQCQTQIVYLARAKPHSKSFCLTKMGTTSKMKTNSRIIFDLKSEDDLEYKVDLKMKRASKMKIHMIMKSTKQFLSDIREPRHEFFKYPIWHQLLASFQLSSIITIGWQVHSQQRDTCWVNKLGKA